MLQHSFIAMGAKPQLCLDSFNKTPIKIAIALPTIALYIIYNIKI